MSMATVYRDYGARSDQSYVDNYANVTPRTQVYQATHSGDGPKSRLPFMNRSFISFTYSDVDGELKHIEDFNLIATISGDRWERDGYTQFNDLTTDYDNLDGQYYWGTHYKSHSITFNLATDGMDQKQLDDFLHWFRAGVSRELILAEHPNRAQMARVQEPPQLSLLPFEGHTTMIISGVERDITTTLYKGEITLTLVMDEPHWYAKDNILGQPRTETINGNVRTYYTNWWINQNGDPVEIFASQDALKILYEDGIPLGSMIEKNMLLGNKAYANVESNTNSLIWSIPEGQIEVVDGEIVEGYGARIDGVIDGTEDPPSIYNNGTYEGRIAGAIVDVSGNGIPSLAKNTNGYFYYAGTAPSPIIISFDIQPTFSSAGYFNTIANTYTNAATPYSTITIESDHVQKLKLTTPNLFTSYNKALDILKNSNLEIVNMRKAIRDEIRHPIVREWANMLISGDVVKSDLSNPSTVSTVMKDLFFDAVNNTFSPITFSFNSKTGEAIGQFIYRQPTQAMNIKTSHNTLIQNSNQITVIEDVGDMLRSNGIYLSDRNHPNSLGKIVGHQNSGEGRLYSHIIYHNLGQPLTNLQIVYKNMYL